MHRDGDNLQNDIMIVVRVGSGGRLRHILSEQDKLTFCVYQQAGSSKGKKSMSIPDLDALKLPLLFVP